MKARDRTPHPFGDDSTIAAIASATGRGAISVVRVSGPGARIIGARLLYPMPASPRHVQFCEVRTLGGELLDEVLAWYFIAPNSYTGEDVLELSTHGGFTVPAAILRAFVEAGARPAEPGEFTRRAVLNGKIDLLQAEAVADLIEARSTAAHRQSLQQLDGGLSRQLNALRERLLHLESLLAYDIDFPEEDDGPISRERIEGSANDLQIALERLLFTSSRGQLIHDGALVVLAGAPNVGKSSLFNALLGETRAIVTDIAGTTRDAIEAVLDLPEFPLRLVDTAGLRETGDPIELLGIETTTRYLRQAALVLACVSPESVEATVGILKAHVSAPVITVGMKADLVTKRYEQQPDVLVSATDRIGLDVLLDLAAERLHRVHGGETGDTPSLTRARHRGLVAEARSEVGEFVRVWSDENLPAPIAATHIRGAANALGELVGAIHVDDVLDVVFSSFCVGK